MRFLLVAAMLLPGFGLGAPLGEEARQIVLVVGRGWNDAAAEISFWEKEGDAWTRTVGPSSCVVGTNGFGLGRGLATVAVARDTPQKREGDRRAPAGVFALEFSFGTMAKMRHGRSSFEYRQTSSSHRWVDDPASAYYNQWVDLASPEVRKDWSSAETLRLVSGLYDLVVVVGHNRQPVVPGAGSAIFLHLWEGPGSSTAGCTAMELQVLREIWKRLDPGKGPVLVQGPSQYLRMLPLEFLPVRFD